MISPLNPENIAEGRVIRANDHGFVLDDCEDSWLNISRYAKPAPRIPHVGARVRATLDGQGYVRSIVILHDEQRTPYEVEDGVDVMPDEEPSRQIEPRLPGTTVPDKDQRITRMACLNTATAILSSGGRACEPADVLALAAKLEAWVGH
jgi:hypothetical protein